ncbi:MAG: hypothetical protein IJD94_04815 [Clostridia bacterium]|nr:hypothetical protein [Clostridia bacterium]
MACLTAQALRSRAREAVLSAGGRGFVRFCAEDDALLVTDAVRRCGSEAQKTALMKALADAGFSVREEAGLLRLAPVDALLDALDMTQETQETDWDSPLHPAQALAKRLLTGGKTPLTDAGRRLVYLSLRLTGEPGKDVLSGLGAIRAQAAVMLRTGDRSGMRLCGAVLWNWCISEKEESA